MHLREPVSCEMNNENRFLLTICCLVFYVAHLYLVKVRNNSEFCFC